MNSSDPRASASTVLDQAADAARHAPASGPLAPPVNASGRELMWPYQGFPRHLAVIGILLAVTVIANINTLNKRYVIKDRSGFTLDSRYIIELDVRSRARQLLDRGELQRKLFVRAASAHQGDVLYGTRADWEGFTAEAKALADPKGPSDFGFLNYFTKDYWWPKGISGLYRPLTSITYWWNFAPIRAVAPGDWETLYRDNPDEYYRIHATALVRFHWTNTVLHGAAAVLTYFVVLAVTWRFFVAAFAGAIYATHPITVESVANIIGRADIFAAIVVSITLLLYIRGTKTDRWVARLPWILAATAVATVGVFFKESAVAAGPVCAVYELIFKYHLRIDGLFRSWKTWFDDLARFLGDFFAAGVGFFFRGWVFLLIPAVAMFYMRSLIFSEKEVVYDNWFVQHVIGVPKLTFGPSTPPEEPFLDNPIRGHPWTGLNENRAVHLLESRVTALKVAVLLLGKMAWPVHLSSDYSFNEVPVFDSRFVTPSDYGAVLAVGVVAGFLGWAVWMWARGNRAGAYFIFFYFWAFMPTANLIKVIGSIMAERFMYLPLLGFAGGLSLLVFWAGEKAARWLAAGATGEAAARRAKLGPAIAMGALSVIVVLYTARTLNRNLAWRSDELLWESALKVSDDSFRSYQSYAFALYENAQIDLVRKQTAVERLNQRIAAAQAILGNSGQSADKKAAAQQALNEAGAEHPAAVKALAEQKQAYRASVKRMIEIDEKGRTIVDSLPDEMNSARLYLHLGMYYAEMARVELRENPDSPEAQKAARPWLEKSIDVLSRAIPIDRAFNRLNRRKEIIRGKPMDEIPDAGLAPVYMVLGEAQIQLAGLLDRPENPSADRDRGRKLLEQAIETYRYVQQLDPMAAVSYFQIGALRLSQNRIEDAVVSLIQGVMLDATRPEPWPMLVEIYRVLGTPQAITEGPGGMKQINASVPIVQQHVRSAIRELIRTMLRGRQIEFARNLRRQAIDVYKLPASAVDVLFDEAGVLIEPPAKVEKDWRRARARDPVTTGPN